MVGEGQDLDPRFTPFQAHFVAWFREALGPGRSYLLAAPVGCGKTFAGAGAVASLLESDRIARVLVLSPATSTAEWAVKAGNWNEQVDIVNARRLRALQDATHAGSQWPSGWYVTSIDFAKQPHVADLLTQQHWDLVLNDEAHRVTDMRWSIVEALRTSRSRPCMLHLATNDSHELVDSLSIDQVLNWQGEVEAFLSARQAVATLTRSDLTWRRSPEEQALARKAVKVALHLGELRGIVLLHRASSSIAALERTLVHGAAGGEPPPGFEDLLDSVEALTVDSKLSQLLAWLQSLEAPTSHPVVIFTDYRDTLDYLCANIADIGVPCKGLHAGHSPEECRAIVESHRDQGGVLVTTGAEGSSISFAAHAVHFDLPLEPVAYAQRVGRYARLGRSRPCEVHVFRDATNTVPFEVVLHRIADRVEVVGATGALQAGALWRAVE